MQRNILTEMRAVSSFLLIARAEGQQRVDGNIYARVLCVVMVGLGTFRRLKGGMLTTQTRTILLGCFCLAGILLGQQLQPSEASAIEAAWASGQRLTNIAIPIQHGFTNPSSKFLNAPIPSVTTDASGIARTPTKFWERIEIHMPRITAADHIACLMVNSKCRPLPVGASIDKKSSILYWHVPNAYKGDFDLVFLQPGSPAGAVRVTAGIGSK